MNNKKCARCGLVSWADAVVCKRCGESLLYDALYDANERSSPSNKRDIVSTILLAGGVFCIVFKDYIGMLAYPLAILALICGLGFAIWRVRGMKQFPQCDTRRGALSALIVNAVLFLVLGAAVPVFVLSNGVPAKSAGWQDYMSPGGRYSIRLPGDPKEKVQKVHTAAGSITVHLVTADSDKNGVYTTSYCDLSEFTQVVSDEELLDRILRNMLNKENSEVLTKTPISIDSVDGLPAAKGFEVETQLDEKTFGKGKVSVARIYWVHERSTMYMNMTAQQRSPENASMAATFLNSFRLVTQSDLDDKFSDASGSSPLIDAAARGDLFKLKSLLGQGASQQDKDLALLKAVYAHKLGAVEQLIEAGANPNAKDLEGKTALMIAVVHADSCVAALIRAGADLNAQDPQHGWTAMMFSLIDGQGISVEQLIAARAWTNVKDVDGKTPLMHAVSYPKYKNLIPRLIEAGADVNAKSKDGRSVLAVAKSLPSDGPERAEIVDALIRKGAKE